MRIYWHSSSNMTLQQHNNNNGNNNSSNERSNNNYNVDNSSNHSSSDSSSNNVSRNCRKSCSCHKRRRCNRFRSNRIASGIDGGNSNNNNAWPLLIAMVVLMLATQPTIAHILKRSNVEQIANVNTDVDSTTVISPFLANVTTIIAHEINPNVTAVTEDTIPIDRNKAVAMALQANETNASIENNHDENNEIFTVVDDDIMKEVKSSPDFVDSKFEFPETLLTEDLEETIRNSVKTQIEIEHNIGSAAVERLKDIPEPEVRKKLTEEILSIEYPQQSTVAQVTESNNIVAWSVKEETENVAEAKSQHDVENTVLTPSANERSKEDDINIGSQSNADKEPVLEEHKRQQQIDTSKSDLNTFVAPEPQVKEEVSNGLVEQAKETPREARNLITGIALSNELIEDVKMQNIEEGDVDHSAEAANDNSISSSSVSSASAESSQNSDSEQTSQEETNSNLHNSDTEGERLDNSIETPLKHKEHALNPQLAAVANTEDAPAVYDEAFSIVLKENLTATELPIVNDNDQLVDLIHLEETLNESHVDGTTVLPEIETNVHIVIKKPGVELDKDPIVLAPQELPEELVGEETTPSREDTNNLPTTHIELQSTVMQEATERNNVDANVAKDDEENEEEGKIIESNEETTTSQVTEQNTEEQQEEQSDNHLIKEEAESAIDDQSTNTIEVEIEIETTVKPTNQENDETTSQPLELPADPQNANDLIEEQDEVLDETPVTSEKSNIDFNQDNDSTTANPTTTVNSAENYSDGEGEGEDGSTNQDIVPELMGGDGADVTASTKGSRSISTQSHQSMLHTTSQMDDSAAATLFESFPPHAAGQTFTDNLAAENIGGEEKILSASSANGELFLSHSGVIVLFASVAVVCLSISVIVFLIIFQRTHGTLDIEMQEQRCGKDNLDEEDEDADTCTKLLEIELPPSTITAMSAEETDECL